MYDLIIVGGGPAGLTAAIYAIRKRLNVLVLSKDLGGKTNYRLSLPWIEDYQIIRGLDVVNKFRNELEYLEFARHIEAVDKVEKVDYILDSDREKFEKKSHKLPDRIVHSLSLCHALTGRSVWIRAVKVNKQ